eukprot:Colp12_sorted_trinity150504_noHs@1852
MSDNRHEMDSIQREERSFSLPNLVNSAPSNMSDSSESDYVGTMTPSLSEEFEKFEVANEGSDADSIYKEPFSALDNDMDDYEKAIEEEVIASLEKEGFTGSVAQRQGFGQRFKERMARQRERLRSMVIEKRIELRLRHKSLAAAQKKREQALRKKWTEWETRLNKSKVFDKYMFLAFVVVLLLLQSVLLRAPQYMPTVYTLIIVPLLAHRVYTFHRDRWHYFLIDYCYFSQALLLFYLHLYPSSTLFFAISFSNGNGSLLWAVVAWRNSLVLHDIGKMTTVFIHILPAIVTYTLRWYPRDPIYNICSNEDCSSTFTESLFAPLLLYLLWQSCYYLKTEVVDKRKIQTDTRIQTSFIWLSNSPNHISYRIMKRFPKSMWNFVFMGTQLLFTFVSTLPVKFYFESHLLHLIVLVGVLAVCTLNGGSFYVEALSRAAARGPVVPDDDVASTSTAPRTRVKSE